MAVGLLAGCASLGNTPAQSPVSEPWVAYAKAQFEARWLALTVGHGHDETIKLEPTFASAPTSDDQTYRQIITGL